MLCPAESVGRKVLPKVLNFDALLLILKLCIGGIVYPFWASIYSCTIAVRGRAGIKVRIAFISVTIRRHNHIDVHMVLASKMKLFFFLMFPSLLSFIFS